MTSNRKKLNPNKVFPVTAWMCGRCMNMWHGDDAEKQAREHRCLERSGR